MEIIQKKNDHKLIFTFKKDTLNYHYMNDEGSGDYDIPYANFPSKSITYIERNTWCNNVGYFWILFGISTIFYRYYIMTLIDSLGIMSIIMGLLCLIWTFLRKIKFTIFRTPHENVLIIQNRKHDEIINEIKSRRKQQLLNLYGQIDFKNNLEDEIKKFKWLKKEKVLTSKEAEEKIWDCNKFCVSTS